MALIIKLGDDQSLPDGALEEISQAARSCKIIAFPTDTVYGLGSTGLIKAAARRIYLIKNRSALKPLPVFHPQELVNLPVKKKLALETNAAIKAAVAKGKKAVGSGRVFLRYSGTEPLLRILVEGPKGAAVRRVARDITAVCRKELIS